MRLLIQRVSHASVIANGVLSGKIGDGLLVFAGFEESDNEKDIEYAVKKVINLRIFDDSQGVMNLSLLTTGGDILLVSQFTLHASTKKGNRPSYIKSAPPKIAIPLYNSFKEALEKGLNREVQTGVFGAEMKVSLLNEGPVTIWIDTKER
ncbi:MAG: D-aminoacyl-tRNA deacylase [Bacteroidales bacterium]|nr:D-aminoacyl-tRNA deacylase [Bacteroidales bacterium]MDD4656307.1 D-aminoacyl-tRNA deacylase [Bacteroidales bacterium]